MHFLNIIVLFMCMYMSMQVEKQSAWSLSCSYRQSWAAQCGCWEPSLGSLEEQQPLSTTESSLSNLLVKMDFFFLWCENTLKSPKGCLSVWTASFFYLFLEPWWALTVTFKSRPPHQYPGLRGSEHVHIAGLGPQRRLNGPGEVTWWSAYCFYRGPVFTSEQSHWAAHNCL